MKNIADLYEIWCFIEMKNMISKILGREPEEINLAEILINNFSIQLRSGKKSKITYKKDNGDLIELFHELKYTDNLSENTLSHTVNQEPDIVLKITKGDFKEKSQFTYLFDAKYRIDDSKSDYCDYPTD